MALNIFLEAQEATSHCICQDVTHRHRHLPQLTGLIRNSNKKHNANLILSEL